MFIIKFFASEICKQLVILISFNLSLGGWPRDINPAELEQVARYRKKVEKDENYVRVITDLAEICEDVLRENNAIDIYEEYFDNVEDVDKSDATPRARTINLFRDPNSVKVRILYNKEISVVLHMSVCVLPMSLSTLHA